MTESGGSTERSYDAIVIGAGVIGCAVAFELSRRGLRTLSIDKLPAAGYGSTSSSSAVVRFNYSTAAGVALAWEGYHYWKNWPEYLELDKPGPLIELVRHPMLMFEIDRKHFERVVGLMQRFAIDHEVLAGAALTERYPQIDFRRFGPPAPLTDLDASFWGEPTETFDTALEMTVAGYVTDPQLAAQNLKDAAIAKGARFLHGRTVTSINQAGGRVTGVSLDDGASFSAPVVVNVGGPHSSQINAMAGVLGDMNINTRALRREVYVVPAPKGVDFETDGVMIGDLDVGVYFRPERGNNVLIGSAEPECDEMEWVDDPDAVGETLTADDFELGVLRTARRVRDLGMPHNKRGVVSAYDVADDWIPIYDRSSLDGFYMAIGTSGNQFKNAASAAHCMAELIIAVQAGHDHDRHPLTVVGRYTGNEVGMATFSRRRTIDPDSTMTVLG